MEPRAFGLRFSTQNGGEVTDTPCVSYPIWSRGAHSRTGEDRVALEASNEPVVRGRVRVQPGNLVAADDSCVVVVMRVRPADVLRVAAEIAAEEDPILRDVRAGTASPRRAGATAATRCSRGVRGGRPQAQKTNGRDATVPPDLAAGKSASPGTRPLTRPLARSRRGGKGRRGRASLHADDHGIRPDQVLRPRVAEARLAHPTHAVRGGVVEAAVGLDQHVQAHQQPEGVLPARVVDQRLGDDQRAPGR